MNGPAVDIAIVGAGAAGLAAGIFAAETRSDLKIVVLDGARSIGAKILVSGGGRCNVTNRKVGPEDFHGPRRIIGKILQRFDEQATVRWFDSLNVPLKVESTGKLFPVTNKARTVLNALLHRCQELDVTILTCSRVQQIFPHSQGFQISHASGEFLARRVILATGGRSLPKTGSDGQGWALAQGLGHTVSPTFPALVPLVLTPTFFHATLSGVSHAATLTTRVEGKPVDCRTGSLLWTHFGISGPVVLDASRFWVIASEKKREVVLSLNVFPERSFEEVDHWMAHVATHKGRKTVGSLLSQVLPSRMVDVLCRDFGSGSGIHFPSRDRQPLAGNLTSIPVNRLPRAQRRVLVGTLTDLSLPVVNSRGWNYAEVTAGGVPLQEVSPQTMGSRIVPGLYLIGEMLDCDGRIGGFNFQWAWATGFIAGSSAATDPELSACRGLRVSRYEVPPEQGGR